MAHTLGKWSLKFTDVASTPDWVIVNEAGKIIATMPETTTKTAQEVSSNAHLIANSKDLYQSLKSLMEEVLLTKEPFNKYLSKAIESAKLVIDEIEKHNEDICISERKFLVNGKQFGFYDFNPDTHEQSLIKKIEQLNVGEEIFTSGDPKLKIERTW